MIENKTLAVIMACHNRREKTLSSLRALWQQSIHDIINIDVYLLDDGSTDGTSEAVNNEFPSVHVLPGDGGLFWNRGMRESFSAAIEKGFDYYLWLNDDSILYENALEVLLSTSAQLEDLGYESGIIGSAMQDPVNHKFTYGGVKRHRTWWGRVKQERLEPGDVVLQCDASNGNCVLIPSSVVSKVGNLDPVYTHRWGDHDYCYRALKQGCSVWLAPGYLGSCQENSIKGTWEDTNLSMIERIRKLNSHRGLQFTDWVTYMRRHRGVWWPAHLVWRYLKIVLQAMQKTAQQQ